MNGIVQREDKFVLEYDLFSLPTAQHKAGLAGLLLMIDSLEIRGIEPLPLVEKLTATSASIVFTRETLQSVFDDLYNAQWIEVESKQKWNKAEPKRVLEKEVQINGRKKKEKRFVYDAVQPKGDFLQVYYPDADGAYVKLWREMLWSILRGIPATRGVYEERAEKKPSSLGSTFWKSLGKSCEQQKKGKVLTEGYSSSIFLGAEDANAERVPFKGSVENNLLLHFWPLVSLTYIPRMMHLEKSGDQGWVAKREEKGYVLAIPEPSDLKIFLDNVRDLLRRLETEKWGRRPQSAFIDFYEEAGLEYLYHFAKNKAVDSQEISFSLCAIELYHLEKQGNRIRQLASERILPRRNVITDYENLRKMVGNPLYKSFSLRNLLDDRAWYEKADGILHRYPAPTFVFISHKTPREIRFFGADVKNKFSRIGKNLKVIQQGGNMGEGERDDQLALRVYRLIQTYVNHRTEEKSGRKFKDFRDNRDDKKRIVYPQEYREARERVCSDAFLAMRGRRDHDFIEYFTGTICAVPQYMSETDYLAVADALMNDWEKIKTLSMLSLSAHSYLSPTTEEEVV